MIGPTSYDSKFVERMKKKRRRNNLVATGKDRGIKNSSQEKNRVSWKKVIIGSFAMTMGALVFSFAQTNILRSIRQHRDSNCDNITDTIINVPLAAMLINGFMYSCGLRSLMEGKRITIDGIFASDGKKNTKQSPKLVKENAGPQSTTPQKENAGPQNTNQQKKKRR